MLKACFEEAKGKELAAKKAQTPEPKKTTSADEPSHRSTILTSTGSKQSQRLNTTMKATKINSWKCYNCGLDGHMTQTCPNPRSTGREAHRTFEYPS